MKPTLSPLLLLPLLIALAGCASTGKKDSSGNAVEGRAYFRTWLVPRTFDTARIFNFYSLLPERPAQLTAERVSSTQMDYLVLKYNQGDTPRETLEPFTAILEWQPRRILEAGVMTLKVNGDGSGVELFANGEDSEGAGFTYNLGRVDWQGWREIKVALDYPDEFYGEKTENPTVVPPFIVNFLGIRDVRGAGHFEIVLAESIISFPKKRPDSASQLSPEEREAIKRNSTVGLPEAKKDNLPVQRPVDTKVRRQRL